MSYQRTEMNNRETSNNERNPFQRNNRSSNYPRSNGPNGSNGSGGYSGYANWKNKVNPQGQPAPPKEKVLTADDFPALLGSGPAKPKGAWGNNSDTTLADRVKDVIAKEEEARARGYVEEEKEETMEVLSLSGKKRQQVKVRLEKDDPKVDVIPLSDWMKSKHQAKAREEQIKRLQDEEYEANYRWQISPQMIPPKPEPEMPEYHEEDLEEEEFDAFEEDQGPKDYEERI